MTTNVVFDFGAVLFSWRPDVLVQKTFPQHTATLEAASALAASIFGHADWHAFDGGKVDLQAVIERTAQRLRLPRDAMHTLMTGIPEHLLPIPETVDLLARLVQRREQHDDVRLYFLSNMPSPFARVLEQRNTFLGWFDGGLFSGDVQLIKPQVDIFHLLQSRYALDPQHTVFLDDLLANVEAARACGWRGIHFQSALQAEHQIMHVGT